MGSEPSYVVIGAGGLGCPALLGLVAGGARSLIVVDDDVVDESNLQRQVLFELADVGVAKVEAARWALRRRVDSTGGADGLELQGIRRRLDPGDPRGVAASLDELLVGRGPTLVLECSDDPALKFAVHDACLGRGVPIVVGGVLGWRGQLMAVDPRQRGRACYRCVFEAPPPAELAPACATVGVVGAVAGQVGHAMAAAALALMAPAPSQADTGPAGRLVHFDLLRGLVRELDPRPRANCPGCRQLERGRGA